MMQRFWCALFASLLAITVCQPAWAADETSDVVIDVVDAATGGPISLARVIVQGESAQIGYTDPAGHARFESLASGTYRAMVVRRGYAGARSPLFEVAARRTTNVRVALAKNGLRQIGSIKVSSAPARASREVGQDDALRHLDGSLREAIGDLPGVTGSAAGYSIDGNDPSQTGTTVDGVSIPGIGGSLTARGINADLFAGAGVSSGASHGSLGGSIGFRTLQPTRFAQNLASFQYASDGSSAAQFATRGSIRNLGYVAQHAARGRTSALTGMWFTDESGLTYRHDGDQATSGDLLKLRWSPSLAHTLTLTGMTSGETSSLACAQQTALFPCGFGPGQSVRQRGSLATLAENATIGATSLFASAFARTSRYDDDERSRTLAGISTPATQSLRSLARGVSLSLQLPAADRHEIAFDASAYTSTLDGTSTNTLGSTPFSQRANYRAATVIDRYARARGLPSPGVPA